jgi:hypothetical protein
MCSFAMRMTRTVAPRYRQRCRLHVRRILSYMADESYSVPYWVILDWDNSQQPPDDARCYRLMCDFMTEYAEEFAAGEGLARSDRAGQGPYGWSTVLGNLVCCCIRAALDVAVAHSAGVLGWTMGDLRRMWAPRPLPSWVLADYPPETATAPDEHGIWL